MRESDKTVGKIHSIETFASVDGPGVRYCLFLQGCSMRCKYCHNPETWSMESDITMTAEEALKDALKYRGYWGDKGGITVSGGEALLQIDFVTEFFALAKNEGINTALDTSGGPFSMGEKYLVKFNRLMGVTDLFILDIKHIDDLKHRELTGRTNSNILQLAKYLSDNNKDMWIRHVLIPGYTDNESDLTELGEFIRTLKTVKKFELLPYHTLGVKKWKDLGRKYELSEVKPPTAEEIKRAESLIKV